MNKLKLIGMTLVIGTLVACTSTPTGTPTAASDQQKEAAIVLQNLARNAAAIAISEDKGNAKFVNLAVTALDEFAVGPVHEPGALTAALAPIVKEVKDIKVKLAIDTATDLYAVFYGRYVKDKVADNEAVLLFIKALRNGAAEAIDITKPSAQLTQPGNVYAIVSPFNYTVPTIVTSDSAFYAVVAN